MAQALETANSIVGRTDKSKYETNLITKKEGRVNPNI